MSIFYSINRFISGTFDTGTATVETIGKALDIANHYVDENHKRINKTTTASAQLSVARFNSSVAKELESDAELKAQYEQVVADW